MFVFQKRFLFSAIYQQNTNSTETETNDADADQVRWNFKIKNWVL